MTKQERFKILKAAGKAISRANWADKIAKKLYPTMLTDIKEINLKRKISEKIPFYSVKRESLGRVTICIHATKHHCKNCIFANNCACKKGGKHGKKE